VVVVNARISPGAVRGIPLAAFHWEQSVRGHCHEAVLFNHCGYRGGPGGCGWGTGTVVGGVIIGSVIIGSVIIGSVGGGTLID
jgi:hypothetical protein